MNFPLLHCSSKESILKLFNSIYYLYVAMSFMMAFFIHVYHIFWAYSLYLSLNLTCHLPHPNWWVYILISCALLYIRSVDINEVYINLLLNYTLCIMLYYTYIYSIYRSLDTSSTPTSLKIVSVPSPQQPLAGFSFLGKGRALWVSLPNHTATFNCL